MLLPLVVSTFSRCLCR
ncbi:hypothetical protein IEO21_11172 [Rhodonia placenta]|uniref:Uncharacterized protein n=1 Tax=Rhodonia placenta TaxID=104341 RepID=A0A8H7NR86_9APHY|nr:hypothetical protein IEO21_11172 [Postia placenta]